MKSHLTYLLDSPKFCTQILSLPISAELGNLSMNRIGLCESRRCKHTPHASHWTESLSSICRTDAKDHFSEGSVLKVAEPGPNLEEVREKCKWLCIQDYLLFHYTFSLFSIPKIAIMKEVTGPVCRALPSHFRNGVLSCKFPLIKLINFKMDLGIVV